MNIDDDLNLSRFFSREYDQDFLQESSYDDELQHTTQPVTHSGRTTNINFCKNLVIPPRAF